MATTEQSFISKAYSWTVGFALIGLSLGGLLLMFGVIGKLGGEQALSLFKQAYADEILETATVRVSWKRPTHNTVGESITPEFIDHYFVHHVFDKNETWEKISGALESYDVKISGEGTHCFLVRAVGKAADGRLLASELSDRTCVELKTTGPVSEYPPQPATDVTAVILEQN